MQPQQCNRLSGSALHSAAPANAPPGGGVGGRQGTARHGAAWHGSKPKRASLKQLQNKHYGEQGEHDEPWVGGQWWRKPTGERRRGGSGSANQRASHRLTGEPWASSARSSAWCSAAGGGAQALRPCAWAGAGERTRPRQGWRPGWANDEDLPWTRFARYSRSAPVWK